MSDITMTPCDPPKPPERSRWRDRFLATRNHPGTWFAVGPFTVSGSTINAARRAQADLGPHYECATEIEDNVLTVKIRYCPPAAAVAQGGPAEPGTTSSPLPVSPAPAPGTVQT